MSLKRPAVERLVASLEKQGASVKRTSKGYMLFFPNGVKITFHTTLSDYRAEKNMRSLVQKAGYVWPKV